MYVAGAPLHSPDALRIANKKTWSEASLRGDSEGLKRYVEVEVPIQGCRLTSLSLPSVDESPLLPSAARPSASLPKPCPQAAVLNAD